MEALAGQRCARALKMAMARYSRRGWLVLYGTYSIQRPGTRALRAVVILGVCNFVATVTARGCVGRASIYLITVCMTTTSEVLAGGLLAAFQTFVAFDSVLWVDNLQSQRGLFLVERLWMDDGSVKKVWRTLHANRLNMLFLSRRNIP